MHEENVDQLSLFEDEESEVSQSTEEPNEDDALKEAIYAQMRKIHNEGMVVGFQTACHTALDRIYAFEHSVGKKSANDYKRCIKELKKFFETGVSRKVNTDAEGNVEETAQN